MVSPRGCNGQIRSPVGWVTTDEKFLHSSGPNLLHFGPHWLPGGQGVSKYPEKMVPRGQILWCHGSFQVHAGSLKVPPAAPTATETYTMVPIEILWKTWNRSSFINFLWMRFNFYEFDKKIMNMDHRHFCTVHDTLVAIPTSSWLSIT